MSSTDEHLRDHTQQAPPDLARPQRSARDLSAGPAFPIATTEDWRDPAAALAGLHEYAERKAIEAIDWYLADKRAKKTASRTLRALAILLAAAGGIQPLVDAALPGRGWAGWGYVLLATAAACVAFDRFFGLSSGWMRDMSTAQALQRRLETFRYDWATECLRGAITAPDEEQVTRALALIREFGEDVADAIERETTDWVVEFQSNLAQLEHRAGREWGGHGDRQVESVGGGAAASTARAVGAVGARRLPTDRAGRF